MHTIRYSLLEDQRDREEVRRGLIVAVLCLLVSVWVHLAGFIVWQALDRNAADHFVFELQPEDPALELTLTFNEPLAAESSSGGGAAMTAVDYPDDGGYQADEAATGDEIQAARLPEIDPDLAASEMMPLGELSDPTPVNPEPPITVEGEAPERKSYYTAIRRAVNNRWIIPPAAQNRFKPGRLTVDFTISPEGELLSWVVVLSTGNQILDHAGQEAIRSAAPFPPFPPEFRKFNQLDIRMNFDYKARYLPRQAGQPASRE